VAAEYHGLQISRRRFVQGAGLAGLGLLAACGRLPRQAEPAPKVVRLGYMGNPVRVHWLREGLRELGYVEGHNLVIDTRAPASYGAGPYAAPMEELVRLRPDVLVAATTPQALAAQQATTTIPVVFIAVSDPVGVGLVASLARPGGNITGQSDFFAGLAGKRLELLKELVPSVTRVAALWNRRNPATALEWRSLQEGSRALGLDLLSADVQSRDELTSAFDRMTRDRADALIVLSDGLFALAETPQLSELVLHSRLPTMYYVRDGVAAGMLMSYGPSLDSLYWRAAYYVDRILKGASPADLPVEQPREFDFVINLRTAQALGLTIPPHVLLQATEVIQ
jgi:putative tryptophan/tyrosine transport system substrate-binding protein